MIIEYRNKYTHTTHKNTPIYINPLFLERFKWNGKEFVNEEANNEQLIFQWTILDFPLSTRFFHEFLPALFFWIFKICGQNLIVYFYISYISYEHTRQRKYTTDFHFVHFIFIGHIVYSSHKNYIFKSKYLFYEELSETRGCDDSPFLSIINW